MQKQLRLTKKVLFQKKMNVRNSNSEISEEDVSFQIMKFFFQFWMLLLLELQSIIQVATRWMMQNTFRSSIMIAISFYA